MTDTTLAKRIFSTEELAEHAPAWARSAVASFAADLTRSGIPFPCPFGVQNYKQGTLRYAFVESSDEAGLAPLVGAVTEYLAMCKTLAPSTSLVCVFRDPATGTIAEYHDWFWSVLQYLHDHDPQPWPADLPTDLDDPRWAYAFGGESYFMVCNTPANRARVSRTSELPLITFTPRWSFKGIEGDTPAGIAVRESIREKVRAYDTVAPFPMFSAYGQGLDWVQYFLPDTNELLDTEAPLVIRRR